MAVKATIPAAAIEPISIRFVAFVMLFSRCSQKPQAELQLVANQTAKSSEPRELSPKKTDSSEYSFQTDLPILPVHGRDCWQAPFSWAGAWILGEMRWRRSLKYRPKVALLSSRYSIFRFGQSNDGQTIFPIDCANVFS
jgi:hypothetical protein